MGTRSFTVSKRSASPFRDAFSRASLVSAKAPAAGVVEEDAVLTARWERYPGPVPEKRLRPTILTAHSGRAVGFIPAGTSPRQLRHLCHEKGRTQHPRKDWHLQTPPLSVHVTTAYSSRPWSR